MSALALQEEAGTLPVMMPTATAVPPANGLRIGLIDSGIDGSHPVLAGATIERHGCDQAVFPAPHGTAVASLLVGRGEGFESVIPGATLYAADIFCGHGGGSLSLLAIALDWMAREKVPVVNISLVGAKSILLTGLVRAMTARGFLLVAAVGNDGPSAPPLYPASYPDVVGVTGVDANRRVLPEACRGEQWISRPRVRASRPRPSAAVSSRCAARPSQRRSSRGCWLARSTRRILRGRANRSQSSNRRPLTSATMGSTRLMVKA